MPIFGGYITLAGVVTAVSFGSELAFWVVVASIVGIVVAGVAQNIHFLIFS